MHFATHLRRFLIFFQVLFLLICIVGLWSDLGKYFTGDQNMTLRRYEFFLQDPFVLPNDLTEGSHVGKLLVALPAKMLMPYMQSYYDTINANIADSYYTKLWHFLNVTVIVNLLLFFLLVCQFLKLISTNKNLVFGLTVALLLLNYPLLKGDLKVLKYDSISLLFSLLAIVFYLRSRWQRQKWCFVAAVVSSALAYAEKDSALSVAGLIFAAELLNFRRGIFLTTKNLLLFIAVWVMTVIAVIPSLWSNLPQFFNFFSGVQNYVALIKSWHILLLAICWAGLYALVRTFGKQMGEWGARHRRWLAIIGVLVFGAGLLAACLYQENNVYIYSNVDKQTRTLIRDNNYVITPGMGGGSFAYPTQHLVLARAMALLNCVRVFFYATPEIITLLLLILGSIFVWRKYTLTVEEKRIFAGISFFLFAHILAFAYYLPPIESRYLLLPSLLAVLASLVLLQSFLTRMGGDTAKLILLFVINLTALHPAFAAHPSYFSYLSVFRSRAVENTEYLQANLASNWTWVGWGEHSFECVQFLEKTFPDKNMIIAFDYAPPFYYAKNVRLIPSPFFMGHLQSEDDFAKGLGRLTEEKAEYLIVSKVVAFRLPVAAYIIKRYGHKALHVVRQNGLEFAWLFRLSDLQVEE